MELHTLTADKLLSLYSDKNISPSEVVNVCLLRINNIECSLKAFITTTDEYALKQAKELKDINRSNSDNNDKPLWGVPVAVKDNICTNGIKTTAGSKILESFIPPYDATVVTKLKDAGAIIIGKANLDEFAMGSSTENSAFSPTKNPWDLNRVPGGSSGGSAAAVAAHYAPLALGSDTGGSVRQPAAFCGIVGLKPTYGSVSRYGLIAFASSLDQIGPMGRTVNDVELLFKVISGYDPKDSTSAGPEIFNNRNCDQFIDKNNFRQLIVGIPNFFIKGLDAYIEKAIKKTINIFEESGVKLIDIELPHLDYALAAYYLVASSEASSNLARYDGTRYGLRCLSDGCNAYEMFRKTRGEGFGKEVKRRIMLGTYALSSGYYDAYYLKAQKVRTLIKQDFTDAFSKCHVILSPTTPTPPFKIGEKTGNPLEMYLSDLYTIPVNMAGLPAISLPAGFTDNNLPIGIQLIGKPFQEQLLFNIGRKLEQELSVTSPPLSI